MGKKKKGRVVFRIEISTETKAVVEQIPESLGITQIAMFSKMVCWLADQPDEIRLSVLGVFPDLVSKDVVTNILERMATGEAQR